MELLESTILLTLELYVVQRYPGAKSCNALYVYSSSLRWVGGKMGVRMRVVNCAGVGGLIDRGGVGMGKVFQLVILHVLYSLGRG